MGGGTSDFILKLMTKRAVLTRQRPPGVRQRTHPKDHGYRRRKSHSVVKYKLPAKEHCRDGSGTSALGLIGDRRAEERLLQLLESETDLMLGDVAHTLGQLSSRKAIPRLRSLLDHDVEWVRQNAKWALAQMAKEA